MKETVGQDQQIMNIIDVTNANNLDIMQKNVQNKKKKLDPHLLRKPLKNVHKNIQTAIESKKTLDSFHNYSIRKLTIPRYPQEKRM